jgi:hypothetical protein
LNHDGVSVTQAERGEVRGTHSVTWALPYSGLFRRPGGVVHEQNADTYKLYAHRRIGILTGGGDVPGLNAVIKSVTYRGSEDDFEVIGSGAAGRG